MVAGPQRNQGYSNEFEHSCSDLNRTTIGKDLFIILHKKLFITEDDFMMKIASGRNFLHSSVK